MSAESSGKTLDPLGAEATAPLPDDAAALKITAKEAADLVRAQTPTALLNVLKKPDHADAIGRVFAGYRVNVDNLKTPLARGRLVSELVTNSKLLDALLALPHPPASAHPRSGNSPLPASTAVSAKQSAPAHEPASSDFDKIAALSAERNSLRQELRDARAAIQSLQSEEGITRRALLAAQSETGDLRARLAAEQAANLSRERRLKRLEREAAEAKQHALALGKRSPSNSPAGARLQAESVAPQSSDATLSVTLFEALERLLSRGKYEPARLLADEMLHGDADNIDALRIRALTRLALGERPAALHDLRAIFDKTLALHDTVPATRALLRWIAVAGAPDAKMAQSLYAAASRESASTLAEIRDALLGLRTGEPEQYDALRSWCQPALAAALFVVGDEQEGRAQLPAQFTQLMAQAAAGKTLTARRLVAAVDQGDQEVVGSVRAALAKLDKRLRDQVLHAVTEAASGDESFGRLLSRRSLAGAAIVDASNVAHYERELMPSARPLLSNVIAVRRTLRERGFFPVQTIGDANLPHIIDSPQSLWEMVQRGEVELVAGGTVADETIVREARRLGATIVSNDYMADWDPAGELVKVQYSISLTDGRASLYD